MTRRGHPWQNGKNGQAGLAVDRTYLTSEPKKLEITYWISSEKNIFSQNQCPNCIRWVSQCFLFFKEAFMKKLKVGENGYSEGQNETAV